MPSLLLIQWGIVSFFVLIHFLIGFKRGTSKSGYYTVVSILMTIFTLWLVSLITIRWFISPEGLLNIVQNATGNGLPADLEQLFLDPNLSGFAFSIIDLVLRLFAFFLIYPLMKWVLTFAIFRTVWKRVVLKELLKRQNENISRNIEQQTSPRPVKTRKRLQLNATSRLLGGAFGAVRGFIVAFVFLLPLLVVASFTAGLSGNSEPLAAEHNDTQLSIVELQDDEVIPGEFQELIDYFNQLNRGPLGSLARATNIDRLLFDMVFTTRIVTPDLPTASINFGEEFEAIFGIVSVLIEGGYLQSDFDVESISADNLDDFEQIFDYLGRSNLIAWVIPIAIKYVVENVLPEQMDGINLYDRPASAAALEAFGDIVWSEEFNQLYNVIEAVLEFASVAELMMYADNPELLAELSPQEGQALADIFRALGQLKSLTLVNIAVDYATTLEDLHEMLAWMTPEEAEAYLQDRLDFILADVEYFVGDEGVLADIANLVEFFFDDTYDVDLSVLFDLEDNPEALLDEAFAEWIGALIDELIEIQLIMELIPMGVDIAIFNAFGEDAEYTFAEDLIDAFEDVEWDQEFTNIGDIYKEIVKLGLGVLFEDDADLYAFIDELAVDHMPTLRVIVQKIFEDSQIINKTFEVAAPAVIDLAFEDDEELRDLLLTILMEDDELAINLGQEVNTILDIVETLYTFTTISELMDMMEMDTEDQLAFIDDLLTEHMPELRAIIGQVFEDSQLVSRAINLATAQVLAMVFDEEDDLYDLIMTVLIEDDVLAIDIVAEFNTILDIVETLYTFTTLSELLTVMDDDTEAQLAFVDDVMTDNMAALRTIIGQIFEDSQIVSRSLDLAIGQLLGLVVDEDDRFYDFIETILIEDDELAIDIVLEFNNIFDIVESLYAFTTLSELIGVGDFETQELVEFVGRFGAIDETEFDQLHDAVLSLQVLARMGASELQFIKDEMEIDMLYVPTTVDLGADLSTILGLVYHAASYVNDALAVTPDYEDIDLAPLFADLEFRAYLMSTEADKHSDLLLANIANLIQTMSEDEEGLGQFLFLPAVLADADPESELWVDEINALLEAVFELAAYFVDSPYVTLSLNGINALTEDIGAVQLGLVTQFADMAEVEAAFGGFDASMIFRISVPAVIDGLEIELVEGYVLALPALVVQDNMLRTGALGETIQAFANFLAELNNTLGFATVSDLTDNEDMLLFLEAYNNINVTAIHTLVGADLLRGIISDALLSPDVQAFIRETVNAGVEGLTVSSDFFAFERSNGLTTQDLADLLIAIHALQITRDVIEAPDMHVFAYLATFDDTKLDTVFDARMLREIITFVMTDTGVMEFVAGLVEEQLDAALADIEMLQDMDLGDLLDVMPILEYIASIRGDDRLFDVVEIKNLIKTVNTLGLTTLYDLNNFQDIEYIHQVIADTQFIEQLFASERIHRSVSYTLINPETHQILADLLSPILEDLTGVAYALDPQLFNLNQPKYDLFEFNTHFGWLINVADIKQLLLSATRVNLLAIPIGEQDTTLDLVFALVDYFMTEDRFGVTHIDAILQSRIIVAVLDKLINLETDDHGLKAYYVSILNNIWPQLNLPLVGDVEFTDNILSMRGISDAQGVLKAEEITKLLMTVALIDLKVDFDNIGLATLLGFINADDNNNDIEDYEELFQSTILMSLITNALNEPAILDIAKGLLEPVVDNLLASNSIFDGLTLDLDPIVRIPTQIVDEDGNLDYMDIRNVLITLDRLGVGSFDSILNDFLNIPINALFILAEIEEDGVNGLRFMADTKTIRYVFDAALKQEGLVNWALELATNIINIDVTGMDLLFGTQFDDATGNLSANHFYEFLLALAAVDVNGVLSGVFTLDLVYELLDRPFTNIRGDRLYHIYNSDIMVHILTEVIENEGLQNFGVDLINTQLTNIVASFAPDLVVTELTREDLGITFALFNEASMRHLILAVRNTGVQSVQDILELNTMAKIINQLDMRFTSNKLLYLLEAPLIKHVISTTLLSDVWVDLAVQFINPLIDNLGLEVTPTLLRLSPVLIGDDGYVKPIHVYQAIVATIVALSSADTFSINALYGLDERYIMVSGVTKSYLDHILDSVFIQTVVSKLFTNNAFRERLAVVATYYVSTLTGVDHTITQENLLFTQAKYGVFERDQRTNQMLMRRIEMKKLYIAATRVDWLNASLGGGLDIVHNVSGILLEEGTDGQRHIDVIMDSKLIVAVFDKVLNMQTDDLRLRPYYTEIINLILPTLGFGDLSVSNNFLLMRHLVDANGVLHPREIIALVETVHLIDITRTFNADTIFTFINADTNNNGVEDFEDLFSSRIVLNVITNALKEEALLTFAKGFAENILDNIALLGGVTLDLDAVLNIPGQVVDGTFGFFDYKDVRRLFTILDLMGVNAISDFSNIGFTVLTNLANATEDGENGMLYVSQTRILRYLFDAILKQEAINVLATDLVKNALNVELTGLNLAIGNQFNDNKHKLSEQHFYELLLALAAFDTSIITSGIIRLGYFYEMFDDPFTTLEGDRLSFVYGSDIIEYWLTTVIENESLQAYGLDILNAQLDTLISGLDSRLIIRDLTAEDLAITFALFNEQAMRALIEAVQRTGVQTIPEILSLNNVDSIVNQLNFITTAQKIRPILEVPLIHHVISTVLLSDAWVDVVAQYRIAFAGISITIDDEFLALSPDVLDENDMVGVDHLLDLLRAAYAVITAGTAVTPQYLQNLEGMTTITGITKQRVDYVLDSEIIYTYVNRLFTTYEFKVIIADLINDFLASQNIDAAVNPDLLNVPEIAMEDGQIKRSELKVFLSAFNTLELETFTELNNFANLEYAHEKIQNTLVVETLFESKWLLFSLSEVFTNELALEALADYLNNVASQLLGVDYTFIADDFDFTLPEYGLFEFDLASGQMLMKVSEIKNFLLAATRVNWIGFSFGSGPQIAVNVATKLVDTGDDTRQNIDVILDSTLIYIVLDMVMQLELIGQYLAVIMSDAVDRDIVYIDLTPPDIMLGKTGTHAPIEVGRVPKAEFRRIITSISVLDLTGSLGLETLTDMVEYGNPNDRFTVFLASNYVYLLIAKVFEDEATANIVNAAITNALGEGNEIDVSPPVETKGLIGIEADLITRAELHRMVQSIQLLGITGVPSADSVTVSTLMDMIGRNDLDPLVDDFMIFLDSLFLQIKISKLLMSSGFIDMLSADETLFDPEDFVLPTNARLVEPDRMIKQELYNLFAGLKALGFDDIENVDIGIDTVTSLTAAEIDIVLDSAYLYVLFDLVIKNQIDLPAGAFEDAGFYVGMIKKSEIKDVFKALEILGISDAGDLDPDNISLAQIKDVVDQTSGIIVKYLISQAIIEFIDPDDEDLIPVDAFVDNDRTTGILKDAEIDSLLDALTILIDDEDDPITSIDFEEVTIGQLKALNALTSVFITRLISDAIIKAVGEDNVPFDAHILGNKNNNLTAVEKLAMISVLEILSGGTTPQEIDDTKVTSIDTENLTVGQVKQLKVSTSRIFKQLFTNAVEEIIDTIPASAYDDFTARLLDAEITKMIDAIDILSADDDDLVEGISTDVTVGQVSALNTLGSIIIDKLISDTMVQMLTAERIPLTAYIGNNPSNNLLATEVTKMIQVLIVLATPMVVPPQTVNDVPIEDIIIDESSLLVGDLKDFLALDSIILNRLISTAIIDALPNLPDESYTELVVKKDVKPSEIGYLLDALEILGIETGDAANVSTDITFADLDDVAALGNTETEGFSPIIVHILSTPMIDAVSDVRADSHDYGIPTTAYRNDYDLEYEEILDLIAALKLIVPGALTIDDAITGLDPETFGPTLLGNLLALESLIIYRMISIGINDAGIATEDAHVTDVAAVNYDPDLPTPALISDIKITEMQDLVVSMTLLGITTVDEVDDIAIGTVLALDDDDIDTLLDNDSTIIYYIIDELFEEPARSIAFPNAEDYDANGRIKRDVLIDWLKANN